MLCARVYEVPKFLRTPGPDPIKMGAWLTPGNTILPRVLSYQISLLYVRPFPHRGSPIFFGYAGLRSLGTGEVADRLETRSWFSCFTELDFTSHSVTAFDGLSPLW